MIIYFFTARGVVLLVDLTVLSLKIMCVEGEGGGCSSAWFNFLNRELFFLKTQTVKKNAFKFDNTGQDANFQGMTSLLSYENCKNK